jgi:pimeloyl-ACP methyl ester carboxylesterase
MTTFVLVHGSFSGGWPWERVLPLLRGAGHHAVAPDLPGHGEDRTPLAQRTLACYVERIGQVIAAQSEPVVLVGHSMGGVVITQTAEQFAERVRALVYICAFLPGNGQSLYALATTDTQSQLLPALEFSETEHWLKPGTAAGVFFHDAPPEDAARAAARMAREPVAPVQTPVQTSAARFGSIPRSYIECTLDRALGIDLQRRMHAAQPATVHSLQCGHFPQVAMPQALAALLAAV